MKRLFWHWAISAIALVLAVAVAQQFNKGVVLHTWYDAIWIAVLLGLVNLAVSFVMFFINILSCPLNLLTLGCFSFVISFVLYTLAVFSLFKTPEGPLHPYLTIPDLPSAMVLAAVMGLFSWLLNMILPSKRRRK